MVTFDGPNKIIKINAGVTDIDVQVDLYSAWKDWFRQDDNSKYLSAFRTFGGDDTAGGQYAPRYFFLTNLWRVLVDGNDNTFVNFAVNLYTDEGDTPFILTNGSHVNNTRSDVPVVGVINVTAAEVWEHASRSLTGVTDANIVSVTDTPVVDVDNFKGLTQEEHDQLTSLENYDDTSLVSTINTIKLDVETLKDMEMGNWKIVGTQMIFYEVGGAELSRYNLLDDTGTPSAETVFERQKV